MTFNGENTQIHCQIIASLERLFDKGAHTFALFLLSAANQTTLHKTSRNVTQTTCWNEAHATTENCVFIFSADKLHRRCDGSPYLIYFLCFCAIPLHNTIVFSCRMIQKWMWSGLPNYHKLFKLLLLLVDARQRRNFGIGEAYYCRYCDFCMWNVASHDVDSDSYRQLLIKHLLF
jgi:hypothetical protein